MTRFDSSIPAAKGVPFREATKRSPDRTINALLPLGLAMGSGIVAFIAVGVIALGLRLPVSVALVASGFIMLLALFGFFAWMVKDKILWTYEEITGRDVTGDGWAGPPVTTHFSLPDGKNRIVYGEVDLPPELVIEWCQAAVRGGSLSFEGWIEKFSLPDGTKGRERYTKFRNWLIEQGYARNVGGPVGLSVNWKNPRAVNWVGGFALAAPEDGTPLLDAIGQGEKNPPSHRLAHTSTLEGDE